MKKQNYFNLINNYAIIFSLLANEKVPFVLIARRFKPHYGDEQKMAKPFAMLVVSTINYTG